MNPTRNRVLAIASREGCNAYRQTSQRSHVVTGVHPKPVPDRHIAVILFECLIYLVESANLGERRSAFDGRFQDR
jgi:hypothetical protein